MREKPEQVGSRRLSRRTLLAGLGVAGIGAGAGLYSLTGPGGTVVEGRTRAKRVLTLQTPPASADVVVIGGGIIGVMTAFELVRRGLKVVVLEKGAIAGEASGRAVGEVVSAGLDASKLPLVLRAKELWGGYNASVAGETGYRRNGHLDVFKDEETAAFWNGWLAGGRSLEREARMLSVAELRGLVDLDGNEKWHGAYYNPSDGGVEPVLAAPIVAEAAMRMGAAIVAPCAARGLDVAGGGIVGVVSEKGTIKTNHVVLAGGCWSTMFATSLGIRLPSFNIFSAVQAVRIPGALPGTANLPDGAWRRQIDGAYSISLGSGIVPLSPGLFRFAWDFRDAMQKAPWDIHVNLSSYFLDQLRTSSHWRMDDVTPFEQLRVLQPAANTALLERVSRGLARDVPSFRSMVRGEAWTGALVATPDNMPTISEYGPIRGLVLATGFTFGMTMAPAAAEAAAELVTGRKPTLDLKPFRYERYVDGSELSFLS